MSNSILDFLFFKKQEFSKTNNKLMYADIEKINESKILISMPDGCKVNYNLSLTEKEMNEAYAEALEAI